MRLKALPSDFRVVESLDPAFLGEGPFAVYQVVKRKRTTLEVAALLAREAGVEKSAVAYAGMKDRQAIAVQHFSVEGGRRISLSEGDLRVRFLGTAPRPISPEANRANAFTLVARGLGAEDLDRVHANLAEVRALGLPNYFDDQRFGCLRHGQGFVARDLVEGKWEAGLKNLIAASSPFDDPDTGGFKAALRNAWGDWVRCAGIARSRDHLSLFRHLAANPDDFRGALAFVAQRIRVLHLHAYQSFLWNRALSILLRERLPLESRVFLKSDMGPLICPRRIPADAAAALGALVLPLPAHDATFPDPSMRRAFDEALAADGLHLARLRIDGVPGFAFKAQDRAAWLRPGFLRAKPPERDELSRGKRKMSFRFELPRGAYATLVMKRLFVPLGRDARPRAEGPSVRVSGNAFPATPRGSGRRPGGEAGPIQSRPPRERP